MAENDITSETETAVAMEGEKRIRRGDGGTYLVVADDSDEFDIALRYATRLARTNRGHLAIVHVVTIDDFQHWGNVEGIMRKELRDNAEKFLWGIARKVNEIDGTLPSLYIEEGGLNERLIDVVNRDSGIVMLVLGASAQASGPGPLVSYFTGKGISRLRVPVLVVPGHLDQQRIDAIT